MKSRTFQLLLAAGVLYSGLSVVQGQQQTTAQPETEEMVLADHAECSFLGARRAEFQAVTLESIRGRSQRASFSELTEAVTARLGGNSGATRNFVPGGSRTAIDQKGSSSSNLIDQAIFGVLQQQGIEPARRGSDYEFARRVTLDLTGHVPAPEKAMAFASSGDPEKRAKLIDELLNSAEWVDKWTMYFGDLYKNTDRIAATNNNRFPEGREAFSNWIHDSLQANKPYNKMAFEVISAAGANNWTQREVNWELGNKTTGGPLHEHLHQS